MIKKFKIFEELDVINIDNIKRGDYVFISCDTYDLEEEPMEVTSNPEKTYDGFSIHARDLKGGHYETYYDYEIERKLTSKEIEYYKNIAKYNL